MWVMITQLFAMTRSRVCHGRMEEKEWRRKSLKVIEQVREMKGLGMGRVIHKKLTSLRIETAGASDSKPEAIIFKDGWG